MAALNIAEPWTHVAVPTLAVWGTADFETSADDHLAIVELVNDAHAGMASLSIIKGMDHLLTPAADEQAAWDRVTKRGPANVYDRDFSKTVLHWLCVFERGTPAAKPAAR